MKHKLGCLQDKEDSRDYIYAPVGVCKYPDNFCLEKVEVKNQGEINSCVAHSIATIKEIQEFYETGKKLKFSVGWIYGYRLPSQYKGECMYPKDAFNNLIKYGDVLYSDFPENDTYDKMSKLADKRKASCLIKAKPYRCKAYARVLNTSDIKQCLYSNKSPVMIVVNIYDSFEKTGKDGIVKSHNGSLNGQHAMTIVGWKQNYWIVQNSWGSTWADKGYCYIKFGDPIILDMYTVTDLNNVRR